MAMAAAQQLNSEGRRIRVVSMPSIETFRAQDSEYQESVLPSSVQARVAVEAGVPDSWFSLVGSCGRVLALHTYGASAPGGDVYQHFGLTTEAVVEAVQTLL